MNIYEEAFKKAVSGVYNKLKKIEKEQEKTNHLIEEFKKDRVNHIEILAIFVAIFAFLSVEFQILKSVTDILRIAGLSVIIFSGILFLLLIYLLLLISG